MSLRNYRVSKFPIEYRTIVWNMMGFVVFLKAQHTTYHFCGLKDYILGIFCSICQNESESCVCIIRAVTLGQTCVGYSRDLKFVSVGWCAAVVFVCVFVWSITAPFFSHHPNNIRKLNSTTVNFIHQVWIRILECDCTIKLRYVVSVFL